MKNTPNRAILLLAAITGFQFCSLSKLTAQTPEGIDFEKQILPILDAKCLSCHQKEHEDAGRIKKPKSGLALDSVEAIMKGGKSYPNENIVPGQPDASWLLKTVLLPEEDDLFMPPKGDKVTPEETALIKKWIEEGAKFGEWKGK